MFRGESGRITAVNTGADRSAPEVVRALYLKFLFKGGLRAIFSFLDLILRIYALYMKICGVIGS